MTNGRLLFLFYSAYFYVKVILRHKHSHLFSEICQRKELLSGSRSCGHWWAGAPGRSQTLTVWQDGCVVWSEHIFWGVEERRGGGRLLLTSPLTHWQSVLESTVHARYVCVIGRVDSMFPACSLPCLWISSHVCPAVPEMNLNSVSNMRQLMHRNSLSLSFLS